MGSNYHLNISFGNRSYEFDLIAKGKDLSSGYTVIAANERDLGIIQQIFKHAQMDGALTIDTLATKLRLLPEVSHVCMTVTAKAHAVGISTILPDRTLSALHPAPIGGFVDKVASTIIDPLQKTCPKGAGSIVMVSRLTEGFMCVSAGTRTASGLNLDGQTAALNGQTSALIGSGSKMFTSLCCMALINRGALNKKAIPPQPLTLNTRVSDVFSPKQMLIFDDQAKARQVTLGMLLSHTSGLVYSADDNRDEREGMSLSDILDAKEPGSVKFYGHPGDQIYSYSNHIGLAAAMLEIACEKPYGDILQEELLTPLGMTRTSYHCPSDDNVLLAYRPPSPSEERESPSSVKMEVKDPMMQGAGGLWSCMDDMAKLGTALGAALSGKGDLTGKGGRVVISAANLQTMIRPQAVNASCGLAFDLEGDVVGKGGGIHGYDFKFKVDTKSGCCVSMMCNHAGQGDFRRYLEISSDALHGLNPRISLTEAAKNSLVDMQATELPIEECSQQFKGFSGCLAFPAERPLTRINFNGTTLPVQRLPCTPSRGLTERYLIVGDSPFQGKELQIYQENHHVYACMSEGLEVWSFGQITKTTFPVVTPSEIIEQLASASGDYIDTSIGGPPPYQIRVDYDKGLTLSFPGSPPSKCLITARSDKEVSFVACLGGEPQCYSFKLIRDDTLGWKLIILHAETETPICKLPQTKI
ncbi:MAG: serine hydrolase [Chlamydiae bacterium]|nr:serine hydrolase [Chlamydiota bacterium]